MGKLSWGNSLWETLFGETLFGETLFGETLLGEILFGETSPRPREALSPMPREPEACIQAWLASLLKSKMISKSPLSQPPKNPTDLPRHGSQAFGGIENTIFKYKVLL